jgi:hypothetical protein
VIDPTRDANKSGTLASREIAVGRLDAPTRDAMWRVFERYYAGTERETFERDLDAKQYVIVLVDSGDGSVQGFSTLQVYDQAIEGRPVVAIFSGDTIVERAYWGQKALQTAFFLFILRQKVRRPGTPLYWFLISKGYKTYLLLSRNFVEYWPRHDRETPPAVAELMDGLARARFGELWDPAAGILRMQGRDGRLRQGVAPVDRESLAQADIRYFVTKNPGYVRGDELVCVGVVDATFALSYAAKRLARVLGIRGVEEAWVSRPASS